MQMSYWRFAAMIATSSLVMFGLMYVHTYAWAHVYFSETRAWMALLMAAVMAIVMLGYMLAMYPRRAVNISIFVTAGVVLAVAIWLVRSQATVSGLDYIEAMVPHHSIAILTSQRARIEDARVRTLADEIIESQRKEIAEMTYLVRAIRRDGERAAAQRSAPIEQMAAGEAVRRAQLATTDLEALTEGELQHVLGPGPRCSFSYAPDRAVVAAVTASESGDRRGLMKVHGRLVPMDVVRMTPGDGFELSSDDVTVVAVPLSPGTDVREAEARFAVGTELEAGYGGFYRCQS